VAARFAEKFGFSDPTERVSPGFRAPSQCSSSRSLSAAGHYKLSPGPRYSLTPAAQETSAQAIAYLQQAIQMNSNYRPPIPNWLAATMVGSWTAFGSRESRGVCSRARARTRSGYQPRNDSLAEAHGRSLDPIIFTIWKFSDSQRRIRRAIELNQCHALPRVNTILWCARTADEAKAEARAGHATRPLTLAHKTAAAVK
jgi:hypothetical protein